MKYRFTDLAAAEVRTITRFYTHERRALGVSFVEALYEATSLVAEMVDVGAGARASLKVVADDRYLGFHEIGRGGIAVDDDA